MVLITAGPNKIYHWVVVSANCSLSGKKLRGVFYKFALESSSSKAVLKYSA